MTTKLRIIVGPREMYVERHGVRSDTRSLDEAHAPEEVRQIAAELWMTIRGFVAWKVWVRHRIRMVVQRKIAALVRDRFPDLRHPGPRPDLIATRPWEKATYGEIFMLPHGVAARLVRTQKGETP